MLRLIRFVLAILAIIVIVTLAVANRGAVPVSFWPLPYAYEVPLFAVALACFILGALIAGVASWVSGWGFRGRAYRDHRRVKALEARERLKEEEADLAELQRQRERRARFGLPSPAS
jgi:uncharacterized integral membrane protein